MVGTPPMSLLKQEEGVSPKPIPDRKPLPDRREYQREYYQKNRERVKARHRVWVQNNRDKVLAKQKRYEQTDKGKATAARHRRLDNPTYRAQLDRNQESHRENHRRWYYGNHEWAKFLAVVKASRRRASIANAEGDATAEQVAARIEVWGSRCWICQKDWEEIDHVKPLSKGGSNWPANLRPICGTCNRRKGAKILPLK